MKKIFVSVIIAVLTVLLCSCGIPAERQECFSVPESFICDLFVTENGVNYEGKLERKDGVYSLNVTSPESVSGLCVKYKDGKFIAAYTEKEMSLTPKESFFMKDIIEFLESDGNNQSAVLNEKGDAYIIEHGDWKLSFKKE